MPHSPAETVATPEMEAHEKGTAQRSPSPHLPWYLNTRTLTSHIFFGPYIFLPMIAGFTWLAAILALMGIWVVTGKPRYEESQADVAFISDVAGKHKAVFIPLVSIVAASYVASLFAERWLRHIDRLPTDLRRRERILDWLAIGCGIIGGLGLIFLAVFDTFNFSGAHWSMTCVFVVFTAFSAIFQAGEVWSLHKDHPDRRSLLRNSVIKLCIIVLAIASAISFAALYGVCRGSRTPRHGRTMEQCNRITSGCAAMEWTTALILVFFYLSLIGDLWPAGKSSPRYMRRLARWQEKNEPAPLQHDFTGRKAFAEHPEAWRARAEEMKEESRARNQGRTARDTPNGSTPRGTPANMSRAATPGNMSRAATPASMLASSMGHSDDTYHTAQVL